MRLQRRQYGLAGQMTAPPIVHEVLRSPGQPLDEATRVSLEPLLSGDFSRVRLHTDQKAAESARLVNAHAYTVGNDIVFGSGQFAPTSTMGRRLLAHELTHTAQQGSAVSSTSGPLAITDPADHSEQEADEATSRVSRADRASIKAGAGLQLARQTSATTSSTKSPQSGTSAKEPPKRADVAMEVGVSRSGFGSFDTELDRKLAKQNQPCRLTLTVNVHFTPQGPWPPGSFSKWQADLVRIVTNRWSFRFLLAPAQPCADEPCKSATAILKVVPVATSGSGVHDVTVNYVKPPNTRSDAATLYAADVKSPGKDLRRGQATVSHEAGHWLGLEHIHCNTDGDECYGVTDEEKADVMGGGEIVSERDYAPFPEAMTRITACQWKTIGHGNAPLFGSSWIAPLAILGGIGGAIAGGLIAAPLGLGAALGTAALMGGLGVGLGTATGALLNEVAR